MTQKTSGEGSWDAWVGWGGMGGMGWGGDDVGTSPHELLA